MECTFICEITLLGLFQCFFKLRENPHLFCTYLPSCFGQLAETGLQMAFDDFVIECNLVSCLQTNEAKSKNSGRVEHSCLQTVEGKTAERSVCLWSECTQVLKNSCHPALPPHHSNNRKITMQNSNSGLLYFLRAECVRKKREDRWR